MRLDILGSCVTRDAFESVKHSFELGNYFARTSIISIMSPPLTVDENSIKLSSHFQKRSVLIDIRKEFFNLFQESKSDYIIIDFIDERFNLIKIDESYITKSNELVASGFLETDIQFDEMLRDNDTFSLWKIKAKEFFVKLLDRYEENHIILHKTKWRSEYIDKYNNINLFKHEKQIEQINNTLAKYYDFIEQEFPNIHVIDMSVDEFYASEKHQWGLAPYHFEEKYYYGFMRKLGEYLSGWVANYYTVETKMGAVNLLFEYDPCKTYLDSATASNIGTTKNLQFDEQGVPLLKVGSNGQYGYHYYPITIGVYALECVSKYHKDKNKECLDKFLRICDYFVSSQEDNGAWNCSFDYFYGVKETGVCKAPWVSALGQGFGISSLIRAYYITKNENYLACALKAVTPFNKSVDEGGVKRELFGQYTFYEEYPTEKPTHILNGFMFSLLGLYDLYNLSKDESVLRIYKRGIETLINTMSFYDLGNVSSYDLTHITIKGNPSKYHYGYHLTHIKLLSAINLIEHNQLIEKVMKRWLSYAKGNISCHRLKQELLSIKVNDLDNHILINDKENCIKINYDIEEQLEYALYLYVNNEKIATKKYSQENSFTFNVTHGDYKVIVFVRDQFGNAVSKEYKLSVVDKVTCLGPEMLNDIRKHTDLSIDNNTIKLNIRKDFTNLKYAYYLNLNGKNIYKQWYTENCDFEFLLNELGTYTVTVFCMDDFGNKMHYENQINYNN